MANTTQDNILIYLQNGNAISPAIAAHEFNCYCLAAVIKNFEIRKLKYLQEKFQIQELKNIIWS